MFGLAAAPIGSHILEEHEIVDGGDELGVFLYGHKKNAYWYGSELSMPPHENLRPTRRQLACRLLRSVLAGLVWA